MIGLKDLVFDLLDEKEAEKFAEWAFGEDYEFIEGMMNFLHRWNNKHGDLYKLNPNSAISIDIVNMIELYRMEGKNE